MKFKSKAGLTSLALGAALLTGGAMSTVVFGHGSEHHEEEAPKAQEVKVVIDGGYKPGSVKVKRGREVHLTFVREEKGGCGDVVRFLSLKETKDGKDVLVERRLKTGEETTVIFTPKTKGTLHFTCGMGMYKGAIVVK